MKIKELKIIGFQSHRASKLEFADGVNAIIGESDSGKSAILRAIRLVAFNEPAGDSFRSRFPNSPAVEVAVKLDTGDEITVAYEQGKRVYFLNDEKFSGFGRNVPEPVKKAFPLDKLNFSLQFDPAFMVSATPASVGQILSELLGLKDVEKLFSALNKREYALKTESKLYKNQLEEAKSRVESLQWVKEAEKLYPQVDNELAMLDEDTAELADLKELLIAFEECSTELSRLEWVERAEELLISILEHVQILESESAELRELGQLYEKIESHSKILESFEWVKQAESLAVRAEVNINDLQKLQSAMLELSAYYAKVSELAQAIREREEEITKLEKQFEEEIGDVCPLCGQPISGGHSHD